MAIYSINDALLELQKECETLQENWQGETADAYIEKVMSQYESYANTIEKCLQGINEELDEVYVNLEDNSDSIYNHTPKKFSSGGKINE